MATAPLLRKLLTLGRSSHRDLVHQVHYLTIENRILRSKIEGRVLLTSRERRRLIRFGKPVGDSLKHLMSIARHETFKRWLRDEHHVKNQRKSRRGRPPTKRDLRELVLEMAKTPGWGYTRILGELRKLGITSVSRTTVRSILKQHGVEPAPDRGELTWSQFLKQHAETLWSCDFFTKEVLTWKGLRRQTVLVFMHIASRRVLVTRSTDHPNGDWVARVAECFPVVAERSGLERPTILVRDNDMKFRAGFDETLKRNGVEPYPLPVRAPLMNAHVERWIKSLKVECLDQFVPVGSAHLDYLVSEYVEHYHTERPHQGKGNTLLISRGPPKRTGQISCRIRLGSVLRHFERAA